MPIVVALIFLVIIPSAAAVEITPTFPTLNSNHQIKPEINQIQLTQLDSI